MSRRSAALGLVLAAACCSKTGVKGGGSAAEPVPSRPTFTMFALAEVRGQIGPCGCTSDPLGDISRTAKLVAAARAEGPVLVVDAGSLLFAHDPIPPHEKPQDDLKADLLAKIYRTDLHVAALGLGPADLAEGAHGVRLPREAVNLAASQVPTVPPVVRQVGAAKVGVFGVIASGAISLPLTDPVAAGKRAVAQLRAHGAQVVVALIQAADKRAAIHLMRAIGGIDLAVAGLGENAPDPDRVPSEPEQIGHGWLVIPANRGQVVSRVDVTLRDPGPLANAIGPSAAKARIAELAKRIADIDTDLARFAKQKDADPKFLAQKRAERARLAAERARLTANPTVVPARGSFFTLSQVRIAKHLACSVPVQDAVKGFDLAAGRANVAAAKHEAVPKPARGKAHYVGMAACEDCHSDEVAFWKKTVHAKAWQVLVDRGQQFDYECIGCHVTGWDQPGGSNLAHNKNLRNVQCETCHGPGSIHVDKGGLEKPLAIIKSPPADLCATECHTHEHSDTFQHDAYLRDIVGKGHGEKLRKKLGNGPTGHALRKAALDKAGRALGAGCTR